MSGVCQVRRQEQPSMARLYPGACPRPGTERCRRPGTRRAPVVPSHARHPRASAASPPEAFPQQPHAALPRLKRGQAPDGRRTRTRPARAAEHGSALPGCLPASRNRAVPSPGHPTRTGSAEPCSAPARQRGKPARSLSPADRCGFAEAETRAHVGWPAYANSAGKSSRAWLGSTRVPARVQEPSGAVTRAPRRAPVVPSHARQPRASAANPPEAFPLTPHAALPRLKRGHTPDGRRTRTRPARAAEHGSALPGCLPRQAVERRRRPGTPTRTGSAEPCSAPARQRGKPARSLSPADRRGFTEVETRADGGWPAYANSAGKSSRAWLGSTRVPARVQEPSGAVTRAPRCAPVVPSRARQPRASAANRPKPFPSRPMRLYRG